MRPTVRFIELGAWLLENGHRAMLSISGGRFPRRMFGMQPVELRTVGRTSGQVRSTMLTAPICEDDRVVLVASMGGHPDHPGWYKNLAAHPDVELVIDDRVHRMRARTASGDERADLWARVVSKYKGYEIYQRNTDREIPVVVCEPRPGRAAPLRTA